MKRSNKLLLLTLLLIFPWFFWGGPGYFDLRSYKFLWNFGHILFFCLLSIGLLKCFAKQSIVVQVSLVLVITAVLGVGVEWTQNGIGREPDLYDLARNFLGSLITLLWFSPLVRTEKKYGLGFCRILVLFLVLSQVVFLTRIWLDEWRIANNPSNLCLFESAIELQRWETKDKARLVNDPVKIGGYSLHVNFDTQQYSGVSLNYFYRDWRQYKALELSIFSPLNNEFEIAVRINDLLHREGEQDFSDRFNRRIVLDPGWNSVVFPLTDIEAAPQGRDMNMSSIESIGIFTVALPESKEIYIDSLRLLKTTPQSKGT